MRSLVALLAAVEADGNERNSAAFAVADIDASRARDPVICERAFSAIAIALNAPRPRDAKAARLEISGDPEFAIGIEK